MVLGRVRDRLRQRRKGEKVRIAFTLDCCDREAISSVATTGGIDSSDIRDLMIESVEHRFGLVDKLPNPSSGYRTMARPIIAEETRALARDNRPGAMHDADPKPRVFYGQDRAGNVVPANVVSASCQNHRTS
jgi:hypothetical protein